MDADSEARLWREAEEETEFVLGREAAAYEAFVGRWEVGELQVLDPILFERLADQRRIFREVQEGGDQEEIRRHGEAMIRGWQAANKRMEDAEIAKALRAWPGAKVTAIRPRT